MQYERSNLDLWYLAIALIDRLNISERRHAKRVLNVIDDVITLVNVNAPVVATTSWWLHFSEPVVA